jgi:hypothetical protein
LLQQQQNKGSQGPTSAEVQRQQQQQQEQVEEEEEEGSEEQRPDTVAAAAHGQLQTPEQRQLELEALCRSAMQEQQQARLQWMEASQRVRDIRAQLAAAEQAAAGAAEAELAAGQCAAAAQGAQSMPGSQRQTAGDEEGQPRQSAADLQSAEQSATVWAGRLRPRSQRLADPPAQARLVSVSQAVMGKLLFALLCCKLLSTRL